MISKTQIYTQTQVSVHISEMNPLLQASAVGVRQSGESPGDREAEAVTNVCPHSYGSVYTETDGETTTEGLLQKTLMIQRQRNGANTNTGKHSLAAVRGTTVYSS